MLSFSHISLRVHFMVPLVSSSLSLYSKLIHFVIFFLLWNTKNFLFSRQCWHYFVLEQTLRNTSCFNGKKEKLFYIIVQQVKKHVFWLIIKVWVVVTREVCYYTSIMNTFTVSNKVKHVLQLQCKRVNFANYFHIHQN